MKIPAYRLLAVLGLWLALTGCQQIDLTPESDPQRVVTGTVKLPADIIFPPETEVLVRVVDNTATELAGTTPPGDIPTLDRGRPAKSERSLGEHIIRAPAGQPVPFQVEFRADDKLMRRGVLIDVRISYHRRVQFRTLSAHMLTLSSLRFPQEVWVQPSH